MKVVTRLRKDAHPIWEKIIEHPFVVELYKGDLPLKKFRFYILQDYHYLITAMKNFGLITSKAPSVEAMREIIDILNLEAKSEFDGYKDILRRLGHTLHDASTIEPIPVSVSYSSFLLSTSSLKSYAEAITSVLPCFWSYAEIADHHRERLSTNRNQLYKDWGTVYGTDSYLSLVEKIKMLVNKAGEGFSYEKLKSVFITASRYEYMFWEAVYNQQEWPV
jgi:thiaminase/transcriptional activator TenA